MEKKPRTDPAPPFDPDDGQPMRHSKVGIWEIYEKIDTKPSLALAKSSFEYLLSWGTSDIFQTVQETLPLFKKNLAELLALPGCRFLLISSLIMTIVTSLLPALSLWFSGQLLNIVETSVESRTVNIPLLLQIAMGEVVCSVGIRFVRQMNESVNARLKETISLRYTQIYYRLLAEMDVPTFTSSDKEAVDLALRLTEMGHETMYTAFTTVAGIGQTLFQLASQSAVLFSVLRKQDDLALLVALFILNITPLFLKDRSDSGPTLSMKGTWAAAVTELDFMKYMGILNVFRYQTYRKEVVAGALAGDLINDLNEMTTQIGSRKTYLPVYRETSDLPLTHQVLLDITERAPMVLLAIRAAQYPASIPVSLAGLNLVTQAITQVTNQFVAISNTVDQIKMICTSLKEKEKTLALKNHVVDGDIIFPDSSELGLHGLSLEFKNVSFKYPLSEKYALQNVSFKISKGELCVIVGSNGSGKSTILKLITRLYDATEGEILIDGINIRSYKLSDLRRALSVLFQDFELFPLSISENISLGNRQFATPQLIEEAARLGGAETVLSKLDKALDTYFDPGDGSLAYDIYHSDPPEETKIFGRDVKPLPKVTNSAVYYPKFAVAQSKETVKLSGGQKQRVALARTFMRTLGDKPSVRCLLFDEPSAAIDPAAEHDLFERLRDLRGDKTMIFSTHRFGNLTRHADLILYLEDKEIIESGTHETLMKEKGQYAKLWTLQAQAFT